MIKMPSERWTEIHKEKELEESDKLRRKAWNTKVSDQTSRRKKRKEHCNERKM